VQVFELSVARGPDKGKMLDVPSDRAFTIGRGHNNDLTLADRLVSSHHASIQFQGGSYVLTDLNSKNQTFVNGAPVASAVILRDQDQIGIGNCVLLVRTTSGTPVSWTDDHDTGPVKASIETGRTMSLDPATIRTALSTMGRSERVLAVLYAAGRLLSEGDEPVQILPRLLDLMFDVVPADRGAVFLLEGGELRPLHARDADGNSLSSLSITRSVVRQAVEEGTSVLTGSTIAESSLETQDSIALHQISSAMCAPIRGRKEVLGAMYLDSRTPGKSFEDADLELLTTVAIHAGMAHENSRLAAESARAERMAAIGLVVAGLAHDIKNYMLGLSLGRELVEMEVRERCSPETLEAWAAMIDAQGRIADLVQDMLAYSKPREPDWALAEPNATLTSAGSAVERRATERGVLLEVKRHPRVTSSWFDPRAIERCLVNLASNAIDATPGGGTVTMRVEPLDAERAVRFHVSDTGAGIPPEARSRVFDLFFSTKQSKGTGLGLAVTRKIVEEHGGTIVFTTEVDEGTTFTITLPRHDDGPPRSAGLSG
jgi:signal transduction histidine kinase